MNDSLYYLLWYLKTCIRKYNKDKTDNNFKDCETVCREFNAESRLQAINNRENYYERCELIHNTVQVLHFELHYSLV